jgi:hypothetical protein
MNSLRRFFLLTGCALLTLCSIASATSIVDVTTALTTSDPTQVGRLSRNGIPQDWAGGEGGFPGIVNTGTTYHYRTFVIPAANIAPGGKLQITLDHLGPNQGTLFVSAYATSYQPNSSNTGNRGFDTNWLGDLGFSGNVFNVDPQFFQIAAPPNTDLVLVVNNTAGGNGGVGDQFHLLVENFKDVLFTNSAPVLTTKSSPTTHAPGNVYDTATLSSGGVNMTGTITFRLYGPNQSTCGGSVVFTSTVTVNGTGTYTSDSYQVPVGKEGVYRWIASYSGDANNAPVTGLCNDPNEATTVLAAGTTVSGNGTINANGCTGTFEIIAAPAKKHGNFSGQADYQDTCAGISLTQTKITGLSIQGDEAVISGTGKVGKKQKVSFTIFVFDLGAPQTDFFEIFISNGYSASGYITSGDVAIK